MIIKVLMLILVIFGLSMCGYMIYSIIKLSKEHSKRMKKFNDISRFKSEIVSYGSEISDINIRTEYLSDVMSIVSDSIELLKDSDVEDRIEARKIFLFNKYGKHIQSLRQEFRNKKLNQILNG